MIGESPTRPQRLLVMPPVTGGGQMAVRVERHRAHVPNTRAAGSAAAAWRVLFLGLLQRSQLLV